MRLASARGSKSRRRRSATATSAWKRSSSKRGPRELSAPPGAPASGAAPADAAAGGGACALERCSLLTVYTAVAMLMVFIDFLCTSVTSRTSSTVFQSHSRLVITLFPPRGRDDSSAVDPRLALRAPPTCRPPSPTLMLPPLAAGAAGAAGASATASPMAARAAAAAAAAAAVAAEVAAAVAVVAAAGSCAGCAVASLSGSGIATLPPLPSPSSPAPSLCSIPPPPAAPPAPAPFAATRSAARARSGGRSLLPNSWRSSCLLPRAGVAPAGNPITQRPLTWHAPAPPRPRVRCSTKLRSFERRNRDNRALDRPNAGNISGFWLTIISQVRVTCLKIWQAVVQAMILESQRS